jgi:hypothetical protein
MPRSIAMETPARSASANGDTWGFAVEFIRYGVLERFASDKNDGRVALHAQIQSCSPSELGMVSRKARCVKSTGSSETLDCRRGPCSDRRLGTISKMWSGYNTGN